MLEGNQVKLGIHYRKLYQYSDLDTYASAAGITRSQYIKSVCGPLVNKAVFESNVRLAALAQAYSVD